MKRTYLLAALLSATGCGGEPSSTVTDAIIGGEPTDGDHAVMMLVSYPDDHLSFDVCTATVVAEDVLLTAAHCVDPMTHAGRSFGVFPRSDASTYTTANTLIPQLRDVAEVHLHPDYVRDAPFYADIAVVVTTEPLGVDPVPVNRAPLDPNLVGAAVRIVGFGATTYGELNLEKHRANTVLVAIDDVDTVQLGDDTHRGCVGDSGGPAFIDQQGEEVLFGVDSYAEIEGCLEPAHYRRTDAHAAFLAPYVPPHDGVFTDGGAGGAGGSTASSGPDGPAPAEGGCSMVDAGGSAQPWWLVALLALLRRRDPDRAMR